MVLHLKVPSCHDTLGMLPSSHQTYLVTDSAQLPTSGSSLLSDPAGAEWQASKARLYCSVIGLFGDHGSRNGHFCLPRDKRELSRDSRRQSHLPLLLKHVIPVRVAR